MTVHVMSNVYLDERVYYSHGVSLVKFQLKTVGFIHGKQLDSFPIELNSHLSETGYLAVVG